MVFIHCFSLDFVDIHRPQIGGQKFEENHFFQLIILNDDDPVVGNQHTEHWIVEKNPLVVQKLGFSFHFERHEGLRRFLHHFLLEKQLPLLEVAVAAENKVLGCFGVDAHFRDLLPNKGLSEEFLTLEVPKIDDIALVPRVYSGDAVVSAFMKCDLFNCAFGLVICKNMPFILEIERDFARQVAGIGRLAHGDNESAFLGLDSGQGGHIVEAPFFGQLAVALELQVSNNEIHPHVVDNRGVAHNDHLVGRRVAGQTKSGHEFQIGVLDLVLELGSFLIVLFNLLGYAYKSCLLHLGLFHI